MAVTVPTYSRLQTPSVLLHVFIFINENVHIYSPLKYDDMLEIMVALLKPLLYSTISFISDCKVVF